MSLEDAQSLFDQAVRLHEIGEMDKAIDLWRQIDSTDSQEYYSKAQYNLGIILEDKKEFNLAEQAYKNIVKEYCLDIYIKAQINLGCLYEQQNILDKAINTFENILKVDSSYEFAKAQFRLGKIFRRLIKYNLSEQAYNNINREDSEEIYAVAQYNLGVLYGLQSRFNCAIQAYMNVSKIGSIENYVKAQFNLGVLYEKNGDVLKAKLAYENIHINDSINVFLSAQINLGEIYYKEKDIDKAEIIYKNILKKYSVEFYAMAQYGLGILYEDQNKEEEMFDSYRNISRKDSSLYFANAQWNLFVYTNDLSYLKNIEINDDLELYAEAQFILGVSAENLKNKIKYWLQIPVNTNYYKLRKYSIHLAKKISALSNSTCENILYKVLEKIDKILAKLFVQSTSEHAIAHYTNLTVSKLLLSRNVTEIKKYEEKSPLRLNTINLMNDPEEGRLLHKLLDFKYKSGIDDLAFISCFTLHHDSLNQFRLYGNEKQEEASGVSLVLKKDFFAELHNAASIHCNESLTKDLIEGEESDDEKKINQRENKLIKMPLYRCIYLDPRSGYIKVAQREEWSFCREDEHYYSERWGDYSKEINNIEEHVRTNLKELSDLVEELNKQELGQGQLQLLAEILLPLRYLIKHMAFKEEQECRMVYVTQMDNDLIQYDEQINRIYIDYEPSVMQHLEKIYIAPKAKDEKTVFEYLCMQGKKLGVNTKGVKVKISQNPFR